MGAERDLRSEGSKEPREGREESEERRRWRESKGGGWVREGEGRWMRWEGQKAI